MGYWMLLIELGGRMLLIADQPFVWRSGETLRMSFHGRGGLAYSRVELLA